VEDDMQRHLAGQSRLLVLADEVDAEAARIEHEDAVGILRGELRELRGEVGLVERRVDLVDDLALVRALEAGELILPRLVVGRHDHDPLVALVGRVLAHALGLAVVLP
jgi:hypothetical protein